MLPTLRSLILTACLGLMAFSQASCAGPTFEDKSREEVFAQAVESSLEDEHSLAAASAYHYFKGSNIDDPRYDRAQRLMAISAERLGLTYAASLWYLDIARSRRDVTLISEAVRGLERIMANGPYDQQVILRGFIARAEISGLDANQLAFISYYQGLDSVQQGLNEWADQVFARIPESSAYRHRATYVQILRDVSNYELEASQKALEALLKRSPMPRDLKLEINRTLARLAFEQGRYKEALTRYQALRQSAPDDSGLLLEMAWTHYYLGEYQRALGLLLALDAPAYGGLIAPERYLLEAMSLRKLCQFEPAQRAAVRLRSRHGRAIQDLYAGVPIQKSKALRRAARLRAQGRDIALFRKRLLIERKMLNDMEGQLGAELLKDMIALYDAGIAEADRREDAELDPVLVNVADDLLAADEGVRLILHELGVALLRGRRQGEVGQVIAQEAPFDEQTQVQYTFNGEFWTDELDDLVVKMEDRCIE